MSIQILTLDFTSKVSGSTSENKNIGIKNGVEFTQTEYDNIFSSELRNTTGDNLNFEFPLPIETQNGLQGVTIFYKSKMDSGENVLRSNDKGVYNNDNTMYIQKLLNITSVDIINNVIKFNITSTGNYGVYDIKCNVVYDDSGLDVYSGNYTYDNSINTSTTVIINKEKLNDISTELNGLPINSLSYVTFSRVPKHNEV